MLSSPILSKEEKVSASIITLEEQVRVPQEAPSKERSFSKNLASRQSGFFLALQQQIFRRLNPSAVLPRTQKEIQRRSPSLLTYLERYGGFRGQKEAGLTMWVFAHALDAAASGDFFATKEYLALGVMALEPKCFRCGRLGAGLCSIPHRGSPADLVSREDAVDHLSGPSLSHH